MTTYGVMGGAKQRRRRWVGWVGGLVGHLHKQILEEFTRGPKQKLYYYLPTQNFVASGVSDAKYQLYMPSPYTYLLSYLEHAVQTHLYEDTNLEINKA